jgi:uncharacterized phage protein (TIGR02220 family)
MGRDPAFLFYSSDFLTGVADLTMEERGQYITLMCLQHQKGHLSEKTIRLALGCDLVMQKSDVLNKFTLDENGFYYNQRLEEEIIKREKVAEIHRASGKKHVKLSETDTGKGITKSISKSITISEDENENINEDVIEVKDIKPFKEIVDYLNKKAKTSYRHTSKKTRELIMARFNDYDKEEEKYTLQDFFTVIDKKVNEWIDTDMQKFLRPETLFSNKFEGYLNQKIIKSRGNVPQKGNFAQRPYDEETLKKLDGSW